MVCAGKVAPVLPAAADRGDARHAAGAELRRPRLLSGTELRDAVVDRCRAEGFDAVRLTRPDAIGAAAGRLASFLAEGRHGSMGWMESRAEERADPRMLWPEVRSVIMLGLNYGPASNPLD